MHKDRAWVVAIGVLAAALPAVVLYQFGPLAGWIPGCLFHRFTGLVCPGCGMTRAAHAALHGHFGEAVRFNPLGMMLLPAALLGLGLEAAGWMRGKPFPVRLHLGGHRAWWLAGVVLGYWVLRNIPAWPFALLAPP